MSAEESTPPPPARLVLRTATDSAWADHAVQHADQTLIDHAHCEKKAAVTALAILSRYPGHAPLLDAMLALARQELEHLRRVLDVLSARGVVLTRDRGDPYAAALNALIRRNEPERLLDTLLVSAIIEARSHERLALLAAVWSDRGLRALYAELALCEAGHQRLFVDLAETLCGGAVVGPRLAELLVAEARILTTGEFRAAVHG